MTAKHIYNIALEIRGKQKSHELIQTGGKNEKNQKTKNNIFESLPSRVC
jgi:hypothetical protein